MYSIAIQDWFSATQQKGKASLEFCKGQVMQASRKGWVEWDETGTGSSNLNFGRVKATEKWIKMADVWYGPGFF